MLRPGRGNREGLRIDPQAQALCFEALAEGTVSILCSDGQGDCTMKGFGDTRDNLPAILELAENGVLPLSRAVATMTKNPAFEGRCGRSGAGAGRFLSHLGEAHPFGVGNLPLWDRAE